jgi:hypothetical protein
MHSLVERINFIFIFAVVIFNQRCAQVGVLTGGPPDTEPPVVVKSIPENGSVKLNQDFIRLYFNESVQIKNPVQEIKIYPYSDSLIKEIHSTSKTLTIKLNPKILGTNTTYQIHFGKSIADLHEGNVLNNYVFVFSTGDEIDTCKLTGNLLFDEEDKSDVPLFAGLFSAKTNNIDSIITSQLPDYLIPVKGNQFRFENLSPGEYFIAVNRFRINQKTFINPFTMNYAGKISDKICISRSKVDTVQIHMMKVLPKKTPVLKKEFSYYGKIRIKLKEPCRVILKSTDGKILATGINPASDSLIYLINDTISQFKCLLHFPDQHSTDTLMFERNKTPERFSYKYTINNSPGQLVEVNLELPARIDIKSFDQCFHVLLKRKQDSSWIEVEKKDIKDSINNFYFRFKFDSAYYFDEYRIQLDSACLNAGGRKNYNSFMSNGKIIISPSKEECGILNAKFIFKMKGYYVLNLVNESGRVMMSKKISIPLNSASEAEFKACLPDNERYVFECIYDDDDNGIRTEGNFWKNILPEKKIILNKKIQIMNNWEIIETFEIP